MKSPRIFVAISWFLVGASAFAGPFGLDQGMPVESFGSALKSTQDPLAFDLENPPKPHPDLKDYRIWFSKKSGLAGILALTDVITCNAFGDQLRSKFSSFQNALVTKYGSPKVTDFLQQGSIWSEANDWMIGLVKEERFLACRWENTKAKPLPDSIESIELVAVGLDSSRGMVKIIYRFRNFQDVVAETKQAKDSAL